MLCDGVVKGVMGDEVDVSAVDGLSAFFGWRMDGFIIDGCREVGE